MKSCPRLVSTAIGGVVLFAGIAAAAPPPNWPAPAKELERRFQYDAFKIVEVKSAGGGVTGASRLVLEYPDGKRLKVKWKKAPPALDGWNNSPRKELATYELQRWFVDEDDFIVPTTAMRCIPMDAYAVIDPQEKPTTEGSNCVLGVFAVWVDQVTAPDGRDFLDKQRIRSDAPYQRFMADFNVLTYLVGHKDGRSGNLLVSTVPGDPRVYAVDNGIAFEPFPWNFLVRNWYRLRVPWLRKETIERLRKVTHEDAAKLGVVAEMRRSGGIWQDVAAGPNLEPNDGARHEGDRLQFGLTQREIRRVEGRLHDLLEEVDEGKIAVR